MGFGGCHSRIGVSSVALPTDASVRPEFQDGRAFWVAGEDGRAWPLEVKGNCAYQWQSLGGLSRLRARFACLSMAALWSRTARKALRIRKCTGINSIGSLGRGRNFTDSLPESLGQLPDRIDVIHFDGEGTRRSNSIGPRFHDSPFSA